MISVVILTKNEQKDLPQCLHSVRWCTDVHVLDCGSTDQTVDIAERFGANVCIHPFESFGKQRNYALDYLDLKNEWVLFLDADEEITDDFRDDILNGVKGASNDTAGFFCCWKMMLEGRWLKRCDNFPKWQMRLLKLGKARFVDFGHGQKEAEIFGNILYIKEPYIHHGFSKGWYHWMERHNKYSTLEASDRYRNRPPFRQIFSKHGSSRNTALKSWLSLLPGWPALRFIQAYIFNMGFTEGMPGLIYCLNISYYEFMIQIKIREIRVAKFISSN